MAATEAPDPSEARDLAEFITVLGELRQWVGGLSYRMLARRVGPLLRPPQLIAHTTVSSVFQPQRRRLDIDLVTIVRALGVDEPEVTRWRQACVRVHVKAKAGGPSGALRQLPANLAAFIGRDVEVKQLLDIAAAAGSGATTVVVSAIDGPAGTGRMTSGPVCGLVRSGCCTTCHGEVELGRVRGRSESGRPDSIPDLGRRVHFRGGACRLVAHDQLGRL